jgi:hypothetical protein
MQTSPISLILKENVKQVESRRGSQNTPNLTNNYLNFIKRGTNIMPFLHEHTFLILTATNIN